MNCKLFSVALALTIHAFAATPACAALSFTPKTDATGLKQVVVSGEFDATDDVSQFIQLVKSTSTAFVTFDSPGGNVIKAMELGRAIRSLKMITVQPRTQECASACALAFMGGVIRYADPGSIGVHRSSLSSNLVDTGAAVSAVQEMTADTVSYMVEMGVDPSLLQLSLKYDSTDIRYLSASEMVQYRVTQKEAAANSQEVATPTAQQVDALFYIEGNGPTQPERFTGHVKWDLTLENSIQFVQASVSFEEPQKLKVVVSFKKNTDPSLPAAAMVETVIADNPTASMIDTVESILMKPNEQDKGEVLIGVPAKITDDVFLFALNNFAEARQVNRRLMLEQNWIDVPMMLRDGRRALLTFSKGEAGLAAFRSALANW